MSFGEKTGRSAFFAVNGTEVVRLSNVPSHQSDLICIGRSVPIRTGGAFLCDADLYVSHTGSIAIYLYGLFSGGAPSPEAVNIIRQCSEVLRSWTHKQLDDISSFYSYEVEGQSSLVIDLLVRGGKITYSDEDKLNKSLDRTLSSRSFVIEVSDAAHIDRTTQDFIRDFCYFRGLDPDEMTEFILELESHNGIVSVLRGSKLGILYAPPGRVPPITLFYFQVSGTRSDICVNPERTQRDLVRSGFPQLAANNLLEFLLQFADRKQTKVPAGGGTVEVLYILPEPLFGHAQELVEQIGQFAASL